MRKLIILVLDDAEGINEAAYQALLEYQHELGVADVVEMISSAEGRYFLPEDHGLN